MLQELLRSVKQHTTGIAYEIIVVDNHSEDGTAEMVRNEFPEIKLIINEENRGVAPARNQAFLVASGRYIVTLDADMLFKENSLKKMVEFMDAMPDAGLCGCKLVSHDDIVQPSARRYPSPMTFVMRRLAFFPFIRRSKILQTHEMTDWDRNDIDRKSTRLNSSHIQKSRMPSSA